MIAYDRYPEYLSRQIYQTATPANQQIGALVYELNRLIEEEIKIVKKNA